MMWWDTAANVLGNYGPAIEAVLAAWILRPHQRTLLVFCVGLVFSVLFNLWLKGVIKDPRPVGTKYTPQPSAKADQFGMPSGHAQTCGYITAYLFAVTKSWILGALCLVIDAVVVWNRLQKRYHSLAQLAVGLLVGAVLGVLVWSAARYIIRGKLFANRQGTSMIVGGFL